MGRKLSGNLAVERGELLGSLDLIKGGLTAAPLFYEHLFDLTIGAGQTASEDDG